MLYQHYLVSSEWEHHSNRLNGVSDSSLQMVHVVGFHTVRHLFSVAPDLGIEVNKVSNFLIQFTVLDNAHFGYHEQSLNCEAVR
jgi:hypothetical protein